MRLRRHTPYFSIPSTRWEWVSGNRLGADSDGRDLNRTVGWGWRGRVDSDARFSLLALRSLRSIPSGDSHSGEPPWSLNSRRSLKTPATSRTSTTPVTFRSPPSSTALLAASTGGSRRSPDLLDQGGREFPLLEVVNLVPRLLLLKE